MDPENIISFAKLLRDNGDKVLNSEFKLTLSDILLRALNDSFSLLGDADETENSINPQSFQVVKPNNSKSQVFRDLQLIYDFVQKTTLLCLTHFQNDHLDGEINITKFRNLKRLEIQKINIKQICGIQSLRSQIEHLICLRSINKIDDIITYCGKDNANGFIWKELRIADFSFNNLKTINNSLEFAQYLQNLNLSHNQLDSCEAIKWLPNLKILNLSFNNLRKIPNFHVEALKRLQMLAINSNFIEELNGVSRLENLNELDLSDNCLIDHVNLLPISTLVSLRWLNLNGNPLSYHPKHRIGAAEYLHKNAASVKFLLDNEPLSKYEKSLTGRYQSYHTVLTTNIAIPMRKTPTQTPSSSVGSKKQFHLANDDNKVSDSMSSSITSLKNKKVKVRSAEIEDENDLKKDELRTVKEQIKDLRTKYQSEWLQIENADLVRNVLGMEETTENEKLEKIESQKLINDVLQSLDTSQNNNASDSSTNNIDFTNISSNNGNINVKNSPENNDELNVNLLASNVESGNDTVYESFSDEKSVVDEQSSEEVKTAGNQTLYQSINEASDIYFEQEEDVESAISDAEENEFDYIVYEKDNSDELFLTVSDVSIKEKDAFTKRTRNKWSLKIFKSCTRITSNKLHITFDTMKKDKQDRVYTVEEDLCQQLEDRLKTILSQRSLRNKTIFQCVKCYRKFSVEICNEDQRINQNISCPSCSSKFVAEITDNLIKSNNPKINESTKQIESNVRETNENEISEIKTSASQSSIGSGTRTKKLISSAASLNESSSYSKISNSQSSFDSNQSVAGSSTNERDNQDFVKSSNMSNRNFYYDSDVEILSNPSQSSIEVLDNGQYSSRKTSEERRISRIPSLETIEDATNRNVNDIYQINENTLTAGNVGLMEFYRNEIQSNSKNNNDDKNRNLTEKKNLLGHVHLTESSSSGSVTDSICTTYEKGEEIKSLKKEESSISTVLGGLLQSTNVLMARSLKSSTTSLQVPSERYKFNFENFNEIDHRLKLFLYQSKFVAKENFKWLIKGKVFNDQSGQYFEGIIVMSTFKMYLMEAFGPENDDINKWLKQILSVTIDRIETVQLLPYKIGLSINIKGCGGILLILQDIIRTDSFLLYLANHPLPSQCSLNYQTDKMLKKITKSANNEQLKMFTVLNSCEIDIDKVSTKKVVPSGFFTTENNLYLTTPNLSWLACNSNMDLQIELMQQMSNLTQVEYEPVTDSYWIYFSDDTEDKNEIWKCKFETKENAESCLLSISKSWEKLFGVPLTN